jgi:hypothetical protein
LWVPGFLFGRTSAAWSAGSEEGDERMKKSKSRTLDASRQGQAVEKSKQFPIVDFRLSIGGFRRGHGAFRRKEGTREAFSWWLALVAVGILVPPIWAHSIDAYVFRASFDLPPGASVFDVLADGRVIALVDDEVFVESEPGGRVFEPAGTLPSADMAPFGAAFLRVSADGTRLAVGNNGGISFTDFEVGVFDWPSLAGVWFRAGHFDAEWFDATRLAITVGAFGQPSSVTLLDTASADPLNPVNPTIVANIGGASAGVAFDAAGNLYTGNGFEAGGPSGTGTIKAFPLALWTSAIAGPPLNFETQGILVVDILSAATLGFDFAGHLHVGGGDFTGPDIDFAALVSSAAVTRALGGMGPVDVNDSTQVRRFDPDSSSATNFYIVTANLVLHELYLKDSASTTVHVFAAPFEPVPAVSFTGLFLICGLFFFSGVALIRKRLVAGDRKTFISALFAMASWSPSWSAADPWADAVVDAHWGLNGSGLYNDPQSVLGAPATHYYDALLRVRRPVSLISGAYNLDAPNGNRLVTTITDGQFIKVRFNEPVEDHPRNPFGIDLIVFGNSFFVGNGFALPETDMESFILRAALFAEPVTVAVSESGLGNPRTHPAEWYVYERGPFADGLFPTNGFLWDRATRSWSAQAEFTLAVKPSLTVSDFGGLSGGKAVELYECSGGGTGFDLSESGFRSIQYVYLTSRGGEVDALADVFPILGDFDRDGDIDLFDFAQFQRCFAGAVGAAGTCECRPADFDGSGDVTIEDFAAVAVYFGASG